MSTNKIATVFLVDVSKKTLIDNFFNNSRQCISRIILKKIFAEDNDEIGVILFGDSESNNNLYNQGGNYKHINVIDRLKIPTIGLFQTINNVQLSEKKSSDWLQGLIVALDYMKTETQGKRFSNKQILMFSNCRTEWDYKRDMFETLISCFTDEKIKLVVVGLDLDDGITDQDHLKDLVHVIDRLGESAVTLTLPELMDSIKYFEKKRKMRRMTNVTLDIGTKIKIPVGWIKLTSEQQRISNWTYLGRGPCQKYANNQIDKGENATFNKTDENRSSVKEEENFRMNVTELPSQVTETVKFTYYGSTRVPLSYSEMEAVKRKSGPPVFSIFMFTKKRNVNPTMFVGSDVYGVVPKVGNTTSESMLSALIDAMMEMNKIAICKRITMRNGKVQIGALLPFSDESGKHMFFLKLPTAEWEQPYPRYREQVKPDEAKKRMFEELVDAMMLPGDLVEEGKGVLVRNPNFQMRSHVLAERVLDPGSDTSVPEYIERLINPCPEVQMGACPVLMDILFALPMLSDGARKAAKTAAQNAPVSTQPPPQPVKQEPDIPKPNSAPAESELFSQLSTSTVPDSEKVYSKLL